MNGQRMSIPFSPERRMSSPEERMEWDRWHQDPSILRFSDDVPFFPDDDIDIFMEDYAGDYRNLDYPGRDDD